MCTSEVFERAYQKALPHCAAPRLAPWALFLFHLTLIFLISREGEVRTLLFTPNSAVFAHAEAETRVFYSRGKSI